jgi:hypothetical protein
MRAKKTQFLVHHKNWEKEGNGDENVIPWTSDFHPPTLPMTYCNVLRRKKRDRKNWSMERQRLRENDAHAMAETNAEKEFLTYA